jgi:hypothetical protein
MADDMDGYAEALALALAALAASPRGTLRMPDSASTIGDVAAHLVACAAIRRRREDPVKAVERHVRQGEEAIATLSTLTDDPDPTAVRNPTPPVLSGIVGKPWALNSGFLHHYGRNWQLSGTMPGLYLTLPTMHPDLDEMGLRFRRELAGLGLPADVVSKGIARAGRNPHGEEDERPWTEFALPMDDERLDYAGSILNLGHQTAHNVQESIRSYARQAAEVHWNADSLSRMMNEVENHCLDAEEDAPSLRFVNASLYAVSVGRTGKLKDSVVIHANFTGLSEALLDIPIRAVLTGAIGTTSPSTTTTADMVKDQIRRQRAKARIGGPTVERTGLALLEAAGIDVGAMRAGLRDKLTVLDTRVHAGPGTNAWMRVATGRITAAVDISKETRWRHDQLEIRRALPESVMSTLAGRPVTDVVGHPALEGAVIRSARMSKGRTIVTVEPRWQPLD